MSAIPLLTLTVWFLPFTIIVTVPVASSGSTTLIVSLSPTLMFPLYVTLIGALYLAISIVVFDSLVMYLSSPE